MKKSLWITRRDGTKGYIPWQLLGMPEKAKPRDLIALRTLSCGPRCKKPCLVHGDDDPFYGGPLQEPAKLRFFVHRLQVAAPEDAVRVLAHAGTTKQATRSDFIYEVWWIEGRRPSAPGFSLHDICVSLDLDYWTMREKLTKMAQAALAEPQARRRLAAVSKPRAVARLSAA